MDRGALGTFGLDLLPARWPGVPWVACARACQGSRRTASPRVTVAVATRGPLRGQERRITWPAGGPPTGLGAGMGIGARGRPGKAPERVVAGRHLPLAPLEQASSVNEPACNWAAVHTVPLRPLGGLSLSLVRFERLPHALCSRCMPRH